MGQPGLGSEIVVLDEQGKVAAARARSGELAGRAQVMMKGYYKQTDKTRDLFWHDADGRLFFKSGDMGRIDEDGFVVLLDRKKDMIISGGFNIYAADIEVMLLKHPDIDRRGGDRHPERAVGQIADGALRAARWRRRQRDRGEGWANAQLSKTQRRSPSAARRRPAAASCAEQDVGPILHLGLADGGAHPRRTHGAIGDIAPLLARDADDGDVDDCPDA